MENNWIEIVCYSDREKEEMRVSRLLYVYFFTIQHVRCIYKQQVYYYYRKGYYAYIQLIRERKKKLENEVSRAISSKYGHR